MKGMVFKSGDASLGRCVGKAAGSMRAIWFWTCANHSGLPDLRSARATRGRPAISMKNVCVPSAGWRIREISNRVSSPKTH
jgi:hypothetical protein